MNWTDPTHRAVFEGAELERGRAPDFSRLARFASAIDAADAADVAYVATAAADAADAWAEYCPKPLGWKGGQ